MLDWHELQLRAQGKNSSEHTYLSLSGICPSYHLLLMATFKTIRKQVMRVGIKHPRFILKQMGSIGYHPNYRIWAIATNVSHKSIK
jgi:hypothetical protein